MALFDAEPVDERRLRRKRTVIALVVFLVLLAAGAAWWFRYWPEEHTVDRFFSALESQQFEKAYGIWLADPDWQQHPDQYKVYPFGQFKLDWGPSGEYGPIKSYHIEGSTSPSKAGANTTGVVVAVRVNRRVDPNAVACLWVEKKSKTINFSPFECQVNP